MSRTSIVGMSLLLGMAVDLGATPSITAIVYDLASVDRTVVLEAEEIASHLFRQAGIDVRWERGNPDAPTARLVDFSGLDRRSLGCSEGPKLATILIRIVPDTPAGVPVGALGLSLPCARYGVAVTIFADRVLRTDSTAPASASVALGHALAHELGHVVLRSNVHTRTGLMSAVWTRQDWELSTRLLLRFHPKESAQMRRSLSAQ